LQATGPDYSEEYLGGGNLADGGFKRMAVVLENAPNFAALVEYRLVEGAGELVEGAGEHRQNASFGDLLRAIGFGDDATEREEILALEKRLEDIAIYASKGRRVDPRPADRQGRAPEEGVGQPEPVAEDQNGTHWKFSNGLRGRDARGRPIEVFRDDVTAVVQQARLCGVRDYRMSDEMVVQLPGLPIREAELERLGRTNKEVYEVIIPLDRAGLVVLMTPQRSEIRVVPGDDYTEQIKDEDDKVLLFLQYGTALILPATTHYSTHHRTSMTGGLHIKTLVTVSKKEFGVNRKEVKPQIAEVPLGNIAVGYAGPVGIKIPKNPRERIAGNFGRHLTYNDYGELNGKFGLHLLAKTENNIYAFPRLFSLYCLPAKFAKPDKTQNDSKKRQGKGGTKNTPSKKKQG
jgi:hypothetical protein